MKWIRLSLTNFLSHRETVLSLTRINSITGPNGAGKSSIRDAIQWAITGSCRGMNKKQNRSGVIRQSAKKAEVDLLFEIGNQVYHIHRDVTPSTHNLSLTEVDGEMEYVGVELTQPAIYKLLGITEEIADLMFDAYSIPGMNGSIRKQTLQRFFSSSGKGALKKYLDSKGFEKLPEQHMTPILDAYATHGLGTVSKGAYSYPVEKRKQGKRDLETLKSAGPRGSHEEQDKSVEDMREDLQTLLDERDEIHALASFDEGRAANLKTSIANLEKTQEHLVDTIEMDREVVEARKTVSVKKRSKAMELVETLKAPDVEVSPASDPNRAERFKLNEWLVAAEEMGCVSVKSIAAVKKRVQSLQPAEQPEPDTEVAEQDDTALDDARDALGEAQSEYAETLEWVGAQSQGIDEHGRNVELLAQMTKELKEIEDKKDEITEGEKQSQIDSVDTDIDALQDKIKAGILAENYVAEHKDHLTKIAKKEGLIKRWNSLAKALDPKNPDLAELLGDDFKTFASFVATDSAALGVKATINTDFTIDVVTKDGPISNLEWASKSEQYRVGVALLFGLCDLVGLKSVVLDEAEVVHGVNRKSLRKLIKSATGIETMILLETGDPHVQPSTNKDVSIHNIVDGQFANFKDCQCKKCLEG